MKLKIELDEEGRKKIFTSSDVMTGAVYLHVRNTLSISQIELSLEATMNLPPSENKQADHPFPQDHRPAKIFETSQILFPEFPLNASTRYTFGKGIHQFKFGIDFSLLLRCLKMPLPPSAVLDSSKWRLAGVFYVLRVTLRGCGTLRRQVRRRRSISFMPIDPPNVKSKACRDLRTVSQVLPCEALGLRSQTQPAAGCLPPYSPSILLEASLGRYRVFQAGETLPLRLWLTLPSRFPEQGTVHLRSLRLSLHGMSALDYDGISLSNIKLHEAHFKLPIRSGSDRETIELTDWVPKQCTIPQMAPKDGTCHYEKGCLLQILCEFSSSNLHYNQFVTVLVPVTVDATSMPPEYEESNVHLLEV
ncbi:hypothetical protein F5Y15DRAFT_38823 [Xylariaceae sp. FL0016]|nr:hypothetical protein F5Y15DRAFT_38823 [Xylariaceae sp. FL0016]